MPGRTNGQRTTLPNGDNFKSIPGAPPGVCAMLAKVGKKEVGKKCTGCGEEFTDPDERIWFCDRIWLGTRENGRWHHRCLK